MILSLRRIITQIFGSAQVEQVERIVRTDAELAARRAEPDAKAAPEPRPGTLSINPSGAQPTERVRHP